MIFENLSLKPAKIELLIKKMCRFRVTLDIMRLQQHNSRHQLLMFLKFLIGISYQHLTYVKTTSIWKVQEMLNLNYIRVDYSQYR